MKSTPCLLTNTALYDRSYLIINIIWVTAAVTYVFLLHSAIHKLVADVAMVGDLVVTAWLVSVAICYLRRMSQTKLP